MKNIILITICTYLSLQTNSQNFIRNNSFEETTSGKYIPKENILQVKHWSIIAPIDPIKNNNGFFDAKYIDTTFNFKRFKNQKSGKIYNCGFVSLEGLDTLSMNFTTIIHIVKPVSGKSFIKGKGISELTLFQTKLKNNLEIGKKYYFEIYYTTKSFKSNSENLRYLNLGAYFSVNNYSTKEEKAKINLGNTNFKPQISFRIKTDISTKKWIKYSTVFEASKNYNYLIIGNFKKTNKDIPIEFSFDNLKLIPYKQAFNTENLNAGDKLKLENVLFEYNKAVLKDESKTTLDLLFNFLKENPKIQIQIQGHTDNVGEQKKNQKLSENRAKAVMDYLTEKGISAERLAYKGYGSILPVSTNSTDKGRADNRRVEIKILNK